MANERSPASAADPPRFVHIRGANTVLPMAMAVAEQYMAEFPEVTVAVTAGGGLHAFQSVMDGSAEIGMLSAELPPAAARAPSRGVKLVRVPFAVDAVVGIVNAGNPVQSLSRDQLVDIFCGRIRNWAEVGGAAGPIKLMALNPTEPANEPWEVGVMGAGAVIDRSATFLRSFEMAQRVGQDPASIGYVRYGAITPAVRPIAIDGVAVTTENIRTGRYAVRRTLSLLHTGTAGRDTLDFVRYFTSPGKGLRLTSLINAVALD